MKRKIKDKTIYGGLFVDKYYIILDDGEDYQVTQKEFDKLKVGDEIEDPNPILDEIAKISQENGLYD